jgi:hypothetical protein
MMLMVRLLNSFLFKLNHQKYIPFTFDFDDLFPLEVKVKPMFGLWAIYVSKKIILILRQRPDFPETNGVWIATNQEHHKSLKNGLPSRCSISPYSDVSSETEWQVLPVDSDDFESSVRKVCELINHNDYRIGRIPIPVKPRT